MDSPSLFLYTNADDSRYTLRQEGALISRVFCSIEEAIGHAETMVHVETSLTVLDAGGRPLIMTTVIPVDARGGQGIE